MPSFSKQMLLGLYQEENTRFEILGYMCWWNIRNVQLTQSQFGKMLEDCGLNRKYARTHNYRSAFIRALRNLEEQRIIRKVEETDRYLVYQFTAEQKISEGQTAELEYDQETIVVLDKESYYKDQDFLKSLVKGREDIRQAVASHFERERVAYSSSDITRYVQKIMGDQADYVSMREQGCLYFVPAGFQGTVSACERLVQMLGGGSRFDSMPVPNVQANRMMVGAAATDELRRLYEKLAVEVKASVDTATDKWTEGKLVEVRSILARIGMYGDVMKEKERESLVNDFSALEKELFPDRELDLTPVTETPVAEPKSAEAAATPV
jgi:hypothetical protein